MRYLVLVYGDEARYRQLEPAKLAAIESQLTAFEARVAAEGALLASERLAPPATARRVRFGGGRRMVTDGPFAETKEALGGIWLLEATDMEQLMGWIAELPDYEGEIEIRAVADKPVT